MPACVRCGKENPEDARFCLSCGAALAAATPEVRKTVTIVRCDLTGSTALGERLDPETLRSITNRYFDAMREALERHGGTVEKFVGDAVMAVFGIPRVHEDDALRAVRAADAMRTALADLNEELERERGIRLAMRTGLTTGEVIAGDPSAGQAFVSGDAANVAARLEQAASAGEILIGEPTYRLVRDAVEAEPLQPLRVKGKEEPVTALRLLTVRAGAEAIPRRLETPLVGRGKELEQLTKTFDDARNTAACRVVTLVGEPGIGKSRLAAELLRRLEDEATVLRGRCLPYGEGITYWPLVEILRTAAHHELRVRIVELLHGEPDADLIASRLSAAVGGDEAYATAEEIAWASRKLFERLARERPLVLVIDDLQWAEPTFLDLLEHVAYLARAAILLLALARAELLDVRPGWPGERIRLESFSHEESERLVSQLTAGPLADELRARIFAAAAGNPLFLEQLVMIGPAAGRDFVVPPTIHALLSARLDALGPDERGVIECASVIGEEFWDGAVRTLRADGSVGRPLLALVRQELITPHDSVFSDEDAFRFVHLLVRDAAYAGLAKQRRADLHERLADWLEGKDAERGTQHAEIVGYHLEQAYRYRRELGGVLQEVQPLAESAGRTLGAAGRRAYDRGDTPAAVNLLRRAADLLRGGELKDTFLIELGGALVETGDFRGATDLFDTLLETGTEPAVSQARVEKWLIDLQTGRSTDAEEASFNAQQAIAELERHGAERGLSRAWLLLAEIANWSNDRAGMAAGAERSAEHARRAGDHRAEAEALRLFAGALVYGATPAPEGIARLEQLLPRAEDNRMVEAALIAPLAALKAMVGEFSQARALIGRAEEIYADLGLRTQLARLGFMIAITERLAGNLEAAERGLRRSVEIFREMGERGRLEGLALELAEVLVAQERWEDAERFVELASDISAGDGEGELICESVRAHLHLRASDRAAAECAARAALAFQADSDDSTWRPRVLTHAAVVLAAVGKLEDAREALATALELYEAKQNVVAAARTRALLDEVARGPRSTSML